MFRDVAYNTNILYVMIDPGTWLIAAIAIFALRSRSTPIRLVVAFIASLALSLVNILWPTGDWLHPYGVPAVLREVAATMIWCVIFLLVQRLFRRRSRGSGQ